MTCAFPHSRTSRRTNVHQLVRRCSCTCTRPTPKTRPMTRIAASACPTAPPTPGHPSSTLATPDRTAPAPVPAPPLGVNTPWRLDDGGDGQVHVVRVDQAHSEASVGSKGPVHRTLAQHLAAADAAVAGEGEDGDGGGGGRSRVQQVATPRQTPVSGHYDKTETTRSSRR